MAPDPSVLLKQAGIGNPLIGLYDVPDDISFDPAERVEPGSHYCLFSFYQRWMAGEYLVLTREEFGCGGCGRSMFSLQTRPRDEFVKFLAETEGLKDSKELMEEWIDNSGTYEPENSRIVVGPLKEEAYAWLKTVTFYVNPDQLSILMQGAQYYSRVSDPPPVISPFGSGCMQLISVFDDLAAAQAAIGATDMAMRQHLPPDILAFTVTVPMYERLCSLDKRSYLFKPFLANLRKARGLG